MGSPKPRIISAHFKAVADSGDVAKGEAFFLKHKALAIEAAQDENSKVFSDAVAVICECQDAFLAKGVGSEQTWASVVKATDAEEFDNAGGQTLTDAAQGAETWLTVLGVMQEIAAHVRDGAFKAKLATQQALATWASVLLAGLVENWKFSKAHREYGIKNVWKFPGCLCSLSRLPPSGRPGRQRVRFYLRNCGCFGSYFFRARHPG